VDPLVATSGDLDDILRIRDQAAAWMEGQGAPGWRPGELSRERLTGRIERGQVFVVRDTGRVVASVTLLDENSEYWGDRGRDGHAGYIHLLVRDRQLSAPGMGEALLGWAEARIAGWGRPLARLTTVAANLSLVRYYTQRGYVTVGLARHPVVGRLLTLLEKQLRLTPWQDARPSVVSTLTQ